ncbi:MAG: TIGR01212 family radical SAM protein [Bacteroidota bacterium]
MTKPANWGNRRRYNAFADRLKEKFGFRLQKLTLDAGFTCPNRDGTKGIGGCTYCNNDAFNPSYCHPEKSIAQQLTEGIEFHKKRYRRAKSFLAYFQAYSNTYAPLAELRKMYDEALQFEDISGIIIGTRPDCVDETKLDYFQQLTKTHFVSIEYGIESCYDRTLQLIHRGHNFKDATDAIQLTAQRGIHTGTHLIFGLPGESREEMLGEAAIISQLPLNSIKFHQLQIIRGTQMELDYALHPESYRFFSLEEYIEFVIDFIERLSPAIAIERFAGEVPPRFLVANSWGLIRNDQINILIEKRLEERDSWQGKYFLA